MKLASRSETELLKIKTEVNKRGVFRLKKDEAHSFKPWSTTAASAALASVVSTTAPVFPITAVSAATAAVPTFGQSATFIFPASVPSAFVASTTVVVSFPGMRSFVSPTLSVQNL
uniref:Uncharacterized protein n=1 Tax=Romanomermis culicivorax TaxID=13658 RepID=A0A915IMY5_ROMCU